ncbi:MAG: hydroxymethylbilane synthase [Firmicutes bacterium]|nr:hydroxymethylbilane synthase [Bacillota bacterium]
MAHLRLGTRQSQLALAQSQLVAERLTALGHTVEMVPLITRGDRVQDRALYEVGGKGLFTAELEAALIAGRVDLAVHSLKDVPTQLEPGLEVVGYLFPEDRRDILISRGETLKTLPPKSRIGTSSLRRVAFLKAVRPDLEFVPLRGNLTTRIEKWRQGLVDGLVLAAAGVLRLGWEPLISEYLDPDVIVPAPGQGILAIEAATHREDLRPIWAGLNDERLALVARVERAVLAAMGSGCQVPLGAYGRWIDDRRLRLTAQVAMTDPPLLVREVRECAVSEALAVGTEVGRILLRKAPGLLGHEPDHSAGRRDRNRPMDVAGEQ